MSATEHMQAAENLLERETADEPNGMELALRAQVHASLALAHLELDRQIAIEIAQLPDGVNDPEEDPIR